MSLNDGCGTAMYVAPEIAGGFMKNSHGFPVDWWGLGCVLMEIVTGKAPFGDIEYMSKFEIFNNINEKEISCPLSMDNNLKNLLKGLLDKDQIKRFNFSRVKSSSWLADVNWDDLYNLKIKSPWHPIDNKNPNTR
jgi:protein kinase A